MKKIFVVAAAMYSSHAGAQQSSPLDSTRNLQEVVVTANRFSQKQASTGKVVTVISRQVIDRSLGRSLSELLNQQAGISIAGAQNNLGTNQDVFLQGAASGRTLILIDGIPAYDPSTIGNTFDLNQFSLDAIERIEIVKGAMSTLYGSDALGGVINIITKKSGNKPLQFYGTSAGGSYQTFKNVAGFNGSKGKSRYNLQYSHLSSKGFSAATDTTGRRNFDRDGFNQHVLNGSFGTALTQQLSWQLNGQWSRYNTDLDADRFKDERDYTFSSKNFVLGTGLQYRWAKGNATINYNYNQTRRNYLDDSLFVGGFAKYTRQQYTGRSQVVEAFTNIELTNNIGLLLGADYRFQNTDQFFYSLSSFGPYETGRGKDSTSMNQYSGYASLLLKNMGGFQLEAGGRYNRHSVYGSNATYSFNPSFLAKNGVKLFANIASGFKAPTLYQLFVVGSAAGQELKAETSRNIDGGVEYSNGAVKARLLYFNRRISNGIEYNLANFRYFNNNLQKDQGLEAELGWKGTKWSVDANYTFVEGEVNTVNFVYDAPTFSYKAKGDTTYNNLFRRPRHAVNVQVGFAPISKLFLSVHGRTVGRRLEPRFMQSPVELKGYTTIDFYTEYKLHSGIKIFADLRNVLNKAFVDVWGYNARRFNFMAGLNVQW